MNALSPAPSPRAILKARALFAGDRIDLRALEANRLLPTLPVLIPAGDNGYAALFRYGAVVLFNLDPVAEASFLNNLRHLIREPLAAPETESADVHIDPEREERVENNIISIKAITPERLQVVADILAKSVVLGYYEGKVSEAFDRIEPLASRLQRGGTGVYKDIEPLRHIGGALLTELTTVGRVEVGEKPEILWERPELERFYVRLADEYELRERHVALERKLGLIARTAETLLYLLQHKRSLRVEWYIVILIVVEILLTLYEMFVRF